MNDHISRKAALAAIESYKIEHCPEYMQNWASKIKRAILDDIVDDVKALPAVEAEPKWIPVTERLPETDGWYQVWTKTPFGGFKSFNKASFHNGEWHGGGGRWNNVTHWMPLPKPPKE